MNEFFNTILTFIGEALFVILILALVIFVLSFLWNKVKLIFKLFIILSLIAMAYYGFSALFPEQVESFKTGGTITDDWGTEAVSEFNELN